MASSGSFLDEQVFRVPPMGCAPLESIGEAFLGMCAPQCLKEAQALDVLHLLEYVLPQHGIHVTPATPDELDGREGATDPDGSRDIEILIASNLWADLLAGGSHANRARATVAHELSHAILHVPVIRRRLTLQHSNPGLLLSRYRRGDLKPYEDPEWQAWTLAGAILLPRATLAPKAGRIPVPQLASLFGVSDRMLVNHARRMKIAL